METASARKWTWRSRRLWLAILLLVLASAAYPTYRFGSAVHDARVRDRVSWKCQLEVKQPPGTKIVALEKTDSGYRCVFADERGRILGRAKP